MRTLLRSLWCRVAMAGLVLGLFGSSPAWAAEVSEADARRIRSVIEAQIAAFRADDATRAFSYAAPGIRREMGTPERFVAMVRSSYPVITARPR